MNHELSIPIAFVAGIASFLSPCVLPLVPGYISMLSGASIEELKSDASGQLLTRVLRNSLAFVAGFSLVFVLLGASATWVGQFLRAHQSTFNMIAGVIVVIFGLHLTGLVKIPLLYREARLDTGAPRRSLGGAFLVGFAFAFGWTPCIGPILAAVLVLAANAETISRGVFLLAVYSAGLAVPFLLTAVGINRFLRFYQGFRRYLHAVEVLSGVLLLFVGGLIFLNRLTWLSGKLGFLNKFAL